MPCEKCRVWTSWESTVIRARDNYLHRNVKCVCRKSICRQLWLRCNAIIELGMKKIFHFTAPSKISIWSLIALLSVWTCTPVHGEYIREFEISEGVRVGTNIGLIGDANPGQPLPPQPPYLIVPVPGSAVDSDLRIKEDTGEIKTKVVLDRELRSSYSFVAIPHDGENIRVIIEVKDENDNSPTFPVEILHIPFPENTPRDVKKTLTPARDADLGIFNTQRYTIVSGNVNSAFRLSSHREDDGVLYLDLQVNGFLDRETIPYYSLLIEASDEGNPPLKGSMKVNITIQDMNDNQPIFNQSRYFATVPENATISTSVLQVLATDIDAGDNGKVTYSINRRQSDRDYMFQIDPKSGIITVNRPLDFEAKEIHELVVVARDNGDQPHETTAFVSIRVIDVNDNQPTINLIFLSDDVTPKISEDAQPGEYVARISVNDPDSKEKYANVNVTLEGGTGLFDLYTQDNTIYLMVVSKPLDREEQSNYTLVVTATDQGSPPLHASRQFDLQVTDVNDNAPEFDQTVYYANVLEVADPGTSVFQLSALDRDEGNNSAISYVIRDTPETHSSWFQIDSKSGLITTRTHVDCETDPEPQLTVIATDAGFPSQSSSATVKVNIRDVNDNEPIFDQSFYNVSVSEAETMETCILKVSATDPDCGVNAMVNYTFGDGYKQFHEFEIRPVSGDICISGLLDHETRSVYEFPVVATDRGGLSTTAMVQIQILDVNDNRPTFYPPEYNVSLRAQHVSDLPVVVVAATDQDSGIYGQVTYEILSGNEASEFRIDSRTGEVFVTKPLSTTQTIYQLEVAAKDGGGQSSLKNADISISIIAMSQKPPIFERPRYTFSTSENVSSGTSIGTVTATSKARSGAGEIRYSIYSGDPNGYFKIDPRRGTIRTASPLDHEAQSFVLLNVLATNGKPPTYGHAQVNISIWDVNDNAPEFDVGSVKISVPENTALNSAIYAVHATDMDSSNNGIIEYRLLQSSNGVFVIDTEQGILMLRQELDYETTQQYKLTVEARDRGSPSMSSNLTINLEVQDVNDNSPVFEKDKYFVKLSESTPVNSQFMQLMATDQDTGNNARLTYSIKEKEYETIFGVFPNSGSLYLKKQLDRETLDEYTLTVVATDNGIPILTSSTTVTITVLDSNDNTPVFSKDVYEYTIEENLPPGTVVGKVSADDKDLGNNASLQFSLATMDRTFKIDPISGEIVTKIALDREVRAVYEVKVDARDGGIVPRQSQSTVRVLVTDVNDNSPIFIEPRERMTTIREDLPPGSEVLQVRATDKDEGNNASIVYSFISSDRRDSFIMNPTTGVLTTVHTFDHKVKSTYVIIVQARDQGNPPRVVNRTIPITIINTEDALPSISSSSVSFKVLENVPIGEMIGVVQAVPSDDRSNSEIKYSIISGNNNDTFYIKRKTGQIFTNKALDYETTPEFMLQIRAGDPSMLTSQDINVQVEVEDVNDQAPHFKEDPVIIHVNETLDISSVIYNFTASDGDSGSNGLVKYSLRQQSPKKLFKLDPVNGALSVLAPLDYEEIQEFILVVSATDQPLDKTKSLRTSLTVRIYLQDQNDNSPKFTSQDRVDVMEDEEIGYPVVYVQATDMDSGENGRVTYIINSGNDKGDFSLDYNTGRLKIAKSLNREISSSYLLNISASDHGSPIRVTYQMVKIFVIDVNDNAPKFTKKIYRANVSESSSPGAPVTKVIATDVDEGSNGNLTYIIPAGIGDNKFRINPVTGEIRTVATLDREEKEEYHLTVYVKDGSLPSLYDTASVLVSLSDVNDHAPEFRDSCYPLRVPENTDLSVIHTVLATDRDSGDNGRLTYSIIGGDPENSFNIDSYSGKLSSKPLDRETRAQHFLMISAEDKGSPSRKGYCNITIIVTDQNDNDPVFSQDKYFASIPENSLLDTVVMQIEAFDSDLSDNAKITYSLSNETQWRFKINNETGVITTAGHLDRERQEVYNFEVQATDGGRYDARFRKALVQITITDENDNEPYFDKYPFSVVLPNYKQPGQQIIQIKAFDRDQGLNADIEYSFLRPETNNFRIDSDTGIITTNRQMMLESGRLYSIELLAKDKGTPSKSCSGLVEIHVGDTKNSVTLQFENASYSVRIPENPSKGTVVARVIALRTDGRRQQINYSFGSGNDGEVFRIGTNSGLIEVMKPWKLNYEEETMMKLTVVAYAEGKPSLFAYTSVQINLNDVNDNVPRFTQDQYVSSVWEGNSKGTYVMMISAADEDTGTNSKMIYHIVDGNHDNAFIIDPPFSGIVKTNIVLDREIRDSYQLTIIAADEGAPQLTGTCTLRINIVDVNDNEPTFPPHSIVEVSEGAQIGTLITTITANDVDTNPPITYDFAINGNPQSMFSIDKFSGKIVLAKQLDYEMNTQYMLKIQASDTAHVAETTITVRVTDVNDNSPTFSNQAYVADLPELSAIGSSVLTVKASDKDEGMNARIKYSLTASNHRNFYVNEDTGTLYTNASLKYDPYGSAIHLVVSAQDSGIPPLISVAAVRIQITDVNNNVPNFMKKFTSVRVLENARNGHLVAQIAASDNDQSRVNSNIDYSIISGNDNGPFYITRSSGKILLEGSLDREKQSEHNLIVLAADRGDPSWNSTSEIKVVVVDVNDNAPKFNQSLYNVTVSESLSIGVSILQLVATDLDDGDNSKLTFDITSGNDQQVFALDSETGLITLREALDYESVTDYRFVIRVIDSNPNRPLSSLATVHIMVMDENDNAPEFPVDRYSEFIPENTPGGSSIFRVYANDNDRGKYGKLNYSIISGKDSSKFDIDQTTGTVTALESFDYELRQQYYFAISVIDIGGKSASVDIEVNIESKDEFTPVFERVEYFFPVVSGSEAGTVIGQVLATDNDGGPDGRIFYTLRTPSNLLGINRTTGQIYLRRNAVSDQAIQVEIEANSGGVGSLKAITTANVNIGNKYFTGNATLQGNNRKENEGLPVWAVIMLICLILLLIVFSVAILMLYRRNMKGKKHPMSDQFDTSFDTIAAAQADLSQYPPRYNDIRHYGHHDGRVHQHGNLTSELSDQSQSTSSGRGSADDNDEVEDEEIRMINEGPLIKEQKVRERHGVSSSGMHDDDNMSDVSVHNTQEYLARLGIDTTKSESNKGSQDLSHSMNKVNLFEEAEVETEDGIDITNLIYAKLNEVSREERGSILEGTPRGFGFGDDSQPSMTGSLSSIVHSEEELQGSYNWDYLLDWGPQYQPLAHVFSEIARLKDDSVPNCNKESKKSLNPQVKTNPPPLLTSVAPRSIAPVALNTVRNSQITLPALPRSPISHESSFTSHAMSPSFSPSLSPLANRSPSISPLMNPGSHGQPIPPLKAPGMSSRSLTSRSGQIRMMPAPTSGSESELRI